MSRTPAIPVSSTNRLLEALPKSDYQRMLPSLRPFLLVFGETIYAPNDLIRHIYFPTSGIISLLAVAEERTSLEVGLVGQEGMAGLPVFMDVKTSRHTAVVQGEGNALMMRANDFRKECDNGGSLSRVLRRYSHSLLTQVSQAAICNRFHPIDARLARWLLMTRDRMQTNEFKLTQDFLSNMLGVRREGVNKAAGILQERNLISYSRGTLKILNEAKLEASACRCYRILKAEAAGAFN